LTNEGLAWRGGAALDRPPSTLPFVLLEGPAPRLDVPEIGLLLDRLDVLRDLALETRRDLDALRRESSQILSDLGAFTARLLSVPNAEAEAGTQVGPGPAARLTVRLLGSFEVRCGGSVLNAWPSKKARLLFAYLAMEPGRLVPKDVLVELFWPDASPARGSNNLSIAVHQLRSALKGSFPDGNHGVIVQKGLYGLDAEAAWVDVREFQACMAKARPGLEKGAKDQVRACLSEALALYRGDFMESDPYEEWTEEPRRSLGMLASRALAWLVEDAAEAGDWQRVLDYSARILERDACDEAGHRWAMAAHWRLGARTKALHQYEVCCSRLEAEIGARPAEETTRLYEQIKSGA